MPGDKGPAASHEEVLEETTKRAEQMQALVRQIVSFVGEDMLPGLPDLPQIDLSNFRGQQEGPVDKLDKRALVLAACAGAAAAGAVLAAAGLTRPFLKS